MVPVAIDKRPAPAESAHQGKPRYRLPLVEGNTPHGTRIGLDGHPQRSAKGLEDCFRLVMRVAPFQIVDMQCHPGMIDESLEKLVNQIHVEIADQFPRIVHRIFQPRASGKIHHHARKRFVERHIGMAITAHAFLVANALLKAWPMVMPTSSTV